MVIVLLVVLLAQAGSGLFSDDEIATQGPLAEKVSNALVGKMSSFHEFNGWIIAVAAGVHVLAIAYYWFGLKENLVKPMWNGWRAVDAGVAQPPMRTAWLAAALLALAAAAVYWLVVVYPKG
jgi:cytochrome b